MTKSQASLNSTLNQVDTFLTDIFVRKFPAIPANIKELIVKYGPYATLVFLIISLPGLLLLLGLSTALSPVSYYANIQTGFHFSLAALVLVVSLVLEGLSIPGLLKRQRAGWNYAYYAALINALYELVNLNLLSFILSVAISFWILFQIKEYYK